MVPSKTSGHFFQAFSSHNSWCPTQDTLRYFGSLFESWPKSSRHAVAKTYTPEDQRMEHNSLEVWKSIFLSKWVMAVGSNRSSSRVSKTWDTNSVQFFQFFFLWVIESAKKMEQSGPPHQYG